MRIILVSFVVSVSLTLLVNGLGLSPGFGAQLLNDAELDAITAAGSFSIEIIPPSLFTPQTTTSSPIAIQSASAAIQAASAALEAAATLQHHQGVPVATRAIQAASAALETIASHNGVGAVNAATEAIQAASSALGELHLDSMNNSPSVLAATKALETARSNLAQNSLQNGTPVIGAASAALKAASAALENVPAPHDVEPHIPTPAMIAASDAVKAASEAINLVSTLSSNGGNPAGIPQNNGMAIQPAAGGMGGMESGELIDPALLTDTPGVKFTFNAGGGTIGSGSAQIPAAAPSVNGTPPNTTPNLTFSGNPILTGNAFQVQNMLLNMNICVQCRASGHIVQTGNGFVFPIQIQ